MKQIFRFFRGELNGFLLNALCTFINRHILSTGLLGELVYHRLFQWVQQEMATESRIPMRDADVFGLGGIGGLFQPRTQGKTTLGSIWFTPSHIVSGAQRSERALLDMDFESFMFVRVEKDTYDTDINTLASARRRTSLREPGATLLGYVKEGVDIFDIEGNVIPGNILSSPPQDAAFIEWYGLKYLHYEETFDLEALLPVSVYMLLFEAVQRIRRRGANIISLLDITALLGENYIYDIEIAQVGWGYICYYRLDEKVTLFNRERRYAAWLNVCASKFKMFTFVDRAIVTQ